MTPKSLHFGVTYHSLYGAITESLHVFIEMGLKYCLATTNHVRVLEVGFGTGLNCFLTYLQSKKMQVDVQYTGIEPYPLEFNVVSALNYTKTLDVPEESDRFFRMHREHQGPVDLGPYFKFEVLQKKLEECALTHAFDLVYYDAFAPNAQPEMWTLEALQVIRSCSRPGTILVTYCAKGQVRRDLQHLGFEVERLPGPPGKREMLRATYSG